MFTIEQIKAAHSKVKSGADFPAYIQDLKALGIQSYEHFVSDGHIEYKGNLGLQLAADPKWNAVEINSIGSTEQLTIALKIHQQGQTDYPTFCKQSADAGVDKWIVDMQNMTCIYYDKKGAELLKEEIPGIK